MIADRSAVLGLTRDECSVTDCVELPYSTGICRAHYERVRKNGDVGPAERMKAHWHEGNRRSDGYARANLPGHPLAARDGRVYLHRVSLYALIGPGPHPCRWCGKAVDWSSADWSHGLVVDHLDYDRSNDAPANLAPACHPCNSGRNRRWAAR